MPYRKTSFAADEYFHLVNRGNLKCDIFRDDADRARFLFYLLYLQSNESIDHPGHYVKNFIKTGNFKFNKRGEREIIDRRFVNLIAFALMDNHFHLIVQAVTDKGVSTYMQKILNAYTKYFNTKYKQSGHLLQGPFRAVHIEDNEQLLYTSAYVHLNPREIGYSGQEIKYPWSSFSDFVETNRWGKLLDPSIILEQMEDKNRGKEYKEWVETSGAKDEEFADLNSEYE